MTVPEPPRYEGEAFRLLPIHLSFSGCGDKSSVVGKLCHSLFFIHLLPPWQCTHMIEFIGLPAIGHVNNDCYLNSLFSLYIQKLNCPNIIYHAIFSSLWYLTDCWVFCRLTWKSGRAFPSHPYLGKKGERECVLNQRLLVKGKCQHALYLAALKLLPWSACEYKSPGALSSRLRYCFPDQEKIYV